MKLLSRFVWLIVGISALVLLSISILNIRANSEFEKIRESISSEYNQLIDKVLAPEKANIYTEYSYDLSNSSSALAFLSQPVPDESSINIFLDTMVLNLFKVDAIWIYKPDGSLFLFKSHHEVEPSAFQPGNLAELSEKTTNLTSNLYFSNKEKVYRVFSSKVGSPLDPQGFLFVATELDQNWIESLQKEINNSEINVIPVGETSAPLSKETILIERTLNSHNNETIAKLKVTLKLPFLKLWEKTSSVDKILLSGALIMMLIILVLFIYMWVISPLKKISSSLEKSNSEDIQPLIKSPTELGDVARMIGDYHKKKEELEASESIKRHIIDQAQVGIVIIDSKSSLIVTANPFACQLIGATEDAIIGNPHSSFFSPFEKATGSSSDSKHSGKSNESTLFTAQGIEIPILRNINKIIMDGKKVVLETFVDLSQIKNLQDKLEEEKLKLNLAMKNSGLVFCEYDYKSGNLIVPVEWEFIKKGSNSSGLENFTSNIYPADQRGFSTQIDSLNMNGKDAFIHEFRLIHPTKGLIWISLSVLVTKRDEQFKPKQLIGLFEDITERINVQQELIKAKEKAEESDRMKTAYLANMSHKIRTPMNAIVGFANLLTEEDFSQEEKNTYIRIIGRDSEQLLRLIDDIINMARLDAEQLDLAEKPFSVNKLLSELTAYYKANEKTTRINFETKTPLPDGKDLLRTDEIKLKMVLNSLLNNAFKFTNQGNIELGYFINPVSKKMILYVKDSGIGIPEDSKNKVFDRFYQADSKTEGTGLGLTISQGLVKLLNGNLNFESKEGEGTSFFVELPFHEN